MSFTEKKKSFFTVSDMMYYAGDGKHGTFGCIRMELDHEIDKNVMKKAFDRTIKRFPYFHVCLSFENGCLIERESNVVPVMHEDPLDYIIDYGDNDNLPYRFSVNDKYVSIYMIHYLTDGSGLVRFLKVILNEYYKELGEDVLPDADAYDIEEEPDPEETFEPFDLVQNTKAPIPDLKKFLRYKSKEKRREDTYSVHLLTVHLMLYVSMLLQKPYGNLTSLQGNTESMYLLL